MQIIMALEHIHLRSEVDGDKMLPATWNGAQKGNYVAYANQLLDDDKQSYLSWYKSKLSLSGREFYVDEYPKLWETYVDTKVGDLGTVYRVAGNKPLDDILALKQGDKEWVIGNVWNVSSLPSGQSTGTIPADKSPNGTAQTDVRIGDQILLNQDGKLDNLRGFIDLSAYQTKTIPSWDSSVTGLPTSVETALTWLYTTNRLKTGEGLSTNTTTTSQLNNTKMWYIGLDAATSTTLGGVKTSVAYDNTKPHLNTIIDLTQHLYVDAPGFALYDAKAKENKTAYFDANVNNGIITLETSNMVLESGKYPSKTSIILNAPSAGEGLQINTELSGNKKYDLQAATSTTLGGIKAASKEDGGSWTEVKIGTDNKLYIPKADANTDNTKIVVGESSISKGSSTGVTFKGVGNSNVEIKNDAVEISSKMSVRVDGQTESTTITPKTLVVGGKNGVSVKYGGTAGDLITIENSGVRSVTQSQTDKHTLSINTNGTTSTITIPDNNTTYNISPKNPTLSFGSTSTVATITPSDGTAIDLKVTLPAKPTDTTYDDYSGSSHGLVPGKKNGTASADYFLNEKGEWTQVESIPTLGKRKIVVGGADGKITTDFSGEIWSENNPPVNNGTNHPYKGNLITLGNDGKIRRAVLNTSNNISKYYSVDNDLYLSGPEFEGSFNTPSDFHRDEKISEYINVQSVAQDGNTPAHNKYIFNIYNNTLTHLATGGNYTYMTSNQSISWRLRDGLGSLYNWEHNEEKYTGNSELTRRFHHAWQNGMYAAYNVLDESAESNTIRRNAFQSNISHGMLLVPPLSAETCAKYPLETSSKPSETTNQGFLIDKYGLHKTEGTGGQILTIEPTKAIRSEIDTVSPKLLFATRCMPTDVSLVLSTGDTGKIHFGDLTQIEMKSDSKGTYIYPLNNCSVEWSNPRCNNTVSVYMIIKPSYFWSSLGRFTYNIPSFELYAQISNTTPSFNYKSANVYGNVSLSEAPVEFVTNYEDLPFINTTFNTPVWRNNAPWSNTVFTYQYAKHLSGDNYSWEDEGKVHIGSTDWRVDKTKTTANKNVEYYGEMYIWDDKDGGEHIPTNRANIDPTIKGNSYFAEVTKYKTATTTTDSQGKPVVTTTYSFDISVRKWNYNNGNGMWTGPEESTNVSSNADYSNINDAAAPLIKKLNNNVMPTLKDRVQFLEGYEKYGICKKLDVYDGATGKVIDVQDDQNTSYLNSETKIATLPTFKLIAWNENATQDTYMIFGKKLNS